MKARQSELVGMAFICIQSSHQSIRFLCSRSLSIFNLISCDFSAAQSKAKTKTKEVSETLKDFEHLLLGAEVDG